MYIGRIDLLIILNIGKIEGGGVINIVIDKVILIVEIRFYIFEILEYEFNYMEKCCKDVVFKFNIIYIFEYNMFYFSFEFSRDSYVFKLSEEVIR